VTQYARHLDLNLLRMLVVLVEERSTTKAAQRLFLSQPAVSGALARLRDALGDPLLVRNGRALEPTARALAIVEAARPHIEALEQAVGEATPFDPTRDARTFRLGCTDAVALATLPALTMRIRTEAPHCRLVVRTGDFLAFPAMLASAEVSTVAGYVRDAPPATARMRVLRHANWVVIRAANASNVRGLDDYCARQHVLVTPSGDLTGFVDDALAELGRKRNVSIGVASFALLGVILNGSDLIATIPDFVAHALAASAPLAIDPAPIAIAPIANALVWRAAVDGDAAERWFRDMVTESFAASMPDGNS
jgi:LysR family transcriptional regulator, mexEF-oprN operon transcriptional activator